MVNEDKVPSKSPECSGSISKLQVCVIPPRTHDWLLQLSWLTTFIEDPRVASIVIYTSMDVATNLEYGISLATKIKLNCGPYLLHIIKDVLHRNVADAVLFTSGMPFEYLSEGYKPQDFLEGALTASHGHLNTFRTDLWYYTQPERGIHPNVGEGLATYGAVLSMLFQVMGRDWKRPDILAHPAGNIFSLKSQDIYLQNSDNALKKLWNRYQLYLGPFVDNPTITETLALCWGAIFGDRNKYIPSTVDPNGKKLAVYGQKSAFTISMDLFNKRHNRSEGKEFEEQQEPSPSIGIVIASKLSGSGLKISERLSLHPNVSTVALVHFDEAPAVINTEVNMRASDGTFLSYLKYIVFNHGNFPDIVLFVEINPNIELDSHSELYKFIDEIMNLQTHKDQLMIRKDIEIQSLRFDDWPDTAEANYAETMYRCIYHVFGFDHFLPTSIRCPKEATFAVHRDTLMKHPKRAYERLFNIVQERGICPSFRTLANRFWAVIFDPERYIVRSRQSFRGGESRLHIPRCIENRQFIDIPGSIEDYLNQVMENPCSIEHDRVIEIIKNYLENDRAGAALPPLQMSTSDTDMVDAPFNNPAVNRTKVTSSIYRYNPYAGAGELTAFSLYRNT
ncbi:hypothetical protein BDD12DRAFT_875776 [Trichophaea hybrida]|nr:hypothetical protein BDD12DRAFT_875776 [Trichophaea hybrida]